MEFGSSNYTNSFAFANALSGIDGLDGSDFEDGWYWCDSESGIYSSRSAYLWFIQQHRVGIPDTSWLWIWRLPSSEKVRFLVW